MMWDVAGTPAGFLVVPNELQDKIVQAGYPDPNIARAIPPALAYGLLLAILGKRSLYLTGDRNVWDARWGELPTAH